MICDAVLKVLLVWVRKDYLDHCFALGKGMVYNSFNRVHVYKSSSYDLTVALVPSYWFLSKPLSYSREDPV